MRGSLSKIILFCLALSLLAAVSCSRPLSTEVFVPFNESGRYEFELDMSDSTALYDISFYTRVDRLRGSVGGFYIDIQLMSPSGQLYVDKVWYDYGASPIADYAERLDPYENGIWKMTVSAKVGGLRGMGVICKKDCQDGTRQTP